MPVSALDPYLKGICRPSARPGRALTDGPGRARAGAPQRSAATLTGEAR